MVSSADEDTSEEEGSGSEDSSDMDVEECEKKRGEFIEDLTELEGQFAILREQLYRERLTQIETKLAEVKAGTATENIECKYDAEQSAASQNYLSEKQLTYDNIKADL